MIGKDGFPAGTEAELILWIEEASAQELISVWRRLPTGHPLMRGNVGVRFAQVFAKRRAEAGRETWQEASDLAGWDGAYPGSTRRRAT